MLEEYQISVPIIQKISSEQAFHYRIVPIAIHEGSLTLKTDTTAIESLQNELKIILDIPIQLESCTSEELQNLLAANYRQIENRQQSNLEYTPDFLEKIIHTAQQIGSSDIHFESYETTSRIRFRLDGKLVEQFHIGSAEYPTIINKIKIRAGLDIAEKGCLKMVELV